MSQRDRPEEPAAPAGCSVASELADEPRLDAVLLTLLGRRRDAVADVFVESLVREQAGFVASSSRVEHRTGSRRCDVGAGLRLVLPDEVRAGHVTDLEGADLESLARRLSGTAAATDDPSSARASVSHSRGDARLGELTEWLAEHAALTLRDSGGDLRLDVQVHHERRQTHVASSEWGHVRGGRDWTIVHVAAQVVGSAGRAPARARRGLGLPAEEALEASDALARLVTEAAAAADRRRGARPVPAGARPVVLAAGSGGVLVHEIVGHGLEADVVARGASVHAGRLGERIAPSHLTVIDDPTRTGRAGSYLHDDEGVAARPTVLLDAGVLKSVLSDGRATGFRSRASSGHGRRASFRDLPLPRMTNTLVEPGSEDPEGLVADADGGILVTRLERAAVDPASGDAAFRVAEGFHVERGRPGAPLGECLLVGRSLDVLAAIDAVGSDFAWDDGCGRCGREGQWLPVAVGQPTLRVAAGGLDVA